jgi:polysaccharide export outer membrane protein
MVVHVLARVRRPGPWLPVLAFFGLLLCMPGCASTEHGELISFLRQHEAEVGTGTYTVRPPDAIALHSPNVPEVDGTIQKIRSDGKVVLRLVGEVDVAGLTPAEIAEKVRTQLARYYVEPEVLVEVSGFFSQRYFVFGEVARPGPRAYRGNDTVLTALAEAQPTFLAWRSRVRVTRPSAEGDARTVIVDLEKMMRTGDLTQNVLLQPGDIIEVPPTPLAWVGHRVRELLYPVDPVLQAYNTPSEAIESTQIYEDHFDSSVDRNDKYRR